MNPSTAISDSGPAFSSNGAYGLEPASSESSYQRANKLEPYEWLITAGSAPFDACSSIFRNKLQDPDTSDDSKNISNQFSTSKSGLLTLTPNLSTSWSLFQATAERQPEQDFLGQRPIQVTSQISCVGRNKIQPNLLRLQTSYYPNQFVSARVGQHKLTALVPAQDDNMSMRRQ